MSIQWSALILYLGLGYGAAARAGVLGRALRRPAPAGLATSPSDAVSFTVLVPARREELVLERTLRRLLACDHPRVTVVAIVDLEEPETIAAARRADDHSGRLTILTISAGPRSKGRALNTALRFQRTNVVAVFDADSRVDPALFERVALWFAHGADVVQTPVSPDPASPAWHGVRTFLDYAAWARGAAGLPWDGRFVRLSGTAVFFRSSVLDRVGGWLPSLTEDFDLAVRLAAARARIAVAYCPEAATVEEAPRTIGVLLCQRIRWHQGFLQLLGQRTWLRLPTARMRWQALGPLLMPVARVLVLVGLVLMAGQLAYRPRATDALLLVPALGVTLAVSLLDCLVFVRVARDYPVTYSWRTLAGLVVGAVPFYSVSMAASVIAVWRQLRRRDDWVTTAHDGGAGR